MYQAMAILLLQNHIFFASIKNRIGLFLKSKSQWIFLPNTKSDVCRWTRNTWCKLIIKWLKTGACNFDAFFSQNAKIYRKRSAVLEPQWVEREILKWLLNWQWKLNWRNSWSFFTVKTMNIKLLCFWLPAVESLNMADWALHRRKKKLVFLVPFRFTLVNESVNAFHAIIEGEIFNHDLFCQSVEMMWKMANLWWYIEKSSYGFANNKKKRTPPPIHTHKNKTKKNTPKFSFNTIFLFCITSKVKFQYIMEKRRFTLNLFNNSVTVAVGREIVSEWERKRESSDS